MTHLLTLRRIDAILCAAALITLFVAARAPQPAPFGEVTTTGAMAMARAAHTATLLADGSVLITGGFDGDETAPFALVERYDPDSGTFAPAGTLHKPRHSHSATRLADGKVLVAGGFDGRFLAHAERYDPATGAFTPTDRLQTARISHQATALADGTVLITGGIGPAGSPIDAAERYDPATGTFVPAGAMNHARNSHTQTLLADGRVLITGGVTGRRATARLHDTAEIYDPATGTFTPTGSLTTPRYKHAAVLLADGRVLITGGSDRNDWRGRYHTAEAYDPATGTFAAAADLAVPRFKHHAAVALLQGGQVLIGGGDGTVELYAPATGQFATPAGRLDAPRFFSTVTPLHNGSALITGGYDRRIQSTARAWRYHP